MVGVCAEVAFGLEVEVLGRGGLVGGGLCFFGEDGLRCIGREGVFRGLLFVAREGDVGAGFEELLPELCVDGTLVTGICGPGGVVGHTLEPSQTFFDCSAYCSTMGRMLVVTILCALLKLWSISTIRAS